MNLLILDNVDSFTYNLVQLFQSQAANVTVLPNTVSWSRVQHEKPDGIVISPGPGTVENPKDFGICRRVILESLVPVLGVCLGHQGIAHAFGGKVIRETPVHGKTSRVWHTGRGVFAAVKNPLVVARYHSLAVDPAHIPDVLCVTAWTQNGAVMGLQHKTRPIWGVQFHPESFLSQEGGKLARNFMKLCQNQKSKSHSFKNSVRDNSFQARVEFR